MMHGSKKIKVISYPYTSDEKITETIILYRQQKAGDKME
jgi:hypothetical protein